MRFKQTCSKRAAVAALFAAVVAAGCSSVKLDSDVPVETRSGTPAASVGAAAGAGANAGSASQSRVTPVDLANKDAANGLANAQRVVYFDFDSFAIKDDFKATIDGYARALQANRGKKLVIEGHTDERGGREYNLALGQKRAEAVRRAMALLGVQEGQMEAVSFGKEKPKALGSDEAA